MLYRYLPCVYVSVIFFFLTLFCIIGYCCRFFLHFSQYVIQFIDSIQYFLYLHHVLNDTINEISFCFCYNCISLPFDTLKAAIHASIAHIILFVNHFFAILSFHGYSLYLFCLSHNIFVLGVIALFISGDVLCSHSWIMRLMETIEKSCTRTKYHLEIYYNLYVFRSVQTNSRKNINSVSAKKKHTPE